MMSKGTKLSLLLISLTILLMAALMSGMIKSNHWTITNIELEAEFKRVNSEQIRVTVAAYPERSFFKIKANIIRENLINIPWVQYVTVNKKWPNTLIIRLIEHKAVAVWNDNQLLNAKGEVFEVDNIDDLTALPQIQGKDDDSVMIWDKFIRYNEIIKHTGYDISSAQVSHRGGWSLDLSNGIHIILGSQQMDAKLVRLADTWAKLIKLNEQFPQYIDLRYTNGYAVQWQYINTENIENIEVDKNTINNTEQQLDTGNING
ncbi:hypothetical protein MNBD_GAMMA01-1516 [hydrothermal vent metagenome]|uniref:POTRA domain-containing protein n=1 Tax=hydrothermal vent metagenome TaxID=652676 RepID=A0A3B0VCU0_9ZZZZ